MTPEETLARKRERDRERKRLSRQRQQEAKAAENSERQRSADDVERQQFCERESIRREISRENEVVVDDERRRKHRDKVNVIIEVG